MYKLNKKTLIILSFTDISVMDSFEHTAILLHEAIIGRFMCLYWLIENEVAHHTNYLKLWVGDLKVNNHLAVI